MKKFLLTASFVGVVGTGIFAYVKLLKETTRKQSRLQIYYDTLNNWLMKKIEGGSAADYLKENDYKRIAIYGMGELGNRLIEDLKDSGIKISYCIDKEAHGDIDENLSVISPDEVDEQEEVDAIIVTPVHYFNEIENKLSRSFKNDIISLEDIVY